MSGYYPPGVTGNEPEIAGYDESERNVECDGVGPTVMSHEVSSLVKDWAFRLEVAAKGMSARPMDDVVRTMALQMREEIAAVPEVETQADCNFEGPVDVVWTSRTTFEWECPRCGTEHEEEID